MRRATWPFWFIGYTIPASATSSSTQVSEEETERRETRRGRARARGSTGSSREVHDDRNLEHHEDDAAGELSELDHEPSVRSCR